MDKIKLYIEIMREAVALKDTDFSNEEDFENAFMAKYNSAKEILTDKEYVEALPQLENIKLLNEAFERFQGKEINIIYLRQIPENMLIEGLNNGTISNQSALMSAHSFMDVGYNNYKEIKSQILKNMINSELTESEKNVFIEIQELGFTTHVNEKTDAQMYEKLFHAGVLNKENIETIFNGRFTDGTRADMSNYSEEFLKHVIITRGNTYYSNESHKRDSQLLDRVQGLYGEKLNTQILSQKTDLSEKFCREMLIRNDVNYHWDSKSYFDNNDIRTMLEYQTLSENFHREMIQRDVYKPNYHMRALVENQNVSPEFVNELFEKKLLDGNDARSLSWSDKIVNEEIKTIIANKYEEYQKEYDKVISDTYHEIEKSKKIEFSNEDKNIEDLEQ